MKKFVLNFFKYFISIFIILNFFAFALQYSLKNSNFYKQQYIKNGENEINFDYIVLGSSTGLTTLNTIQIDSTLNLKGFNLSLDDSSLNSHFLSLKYFYSINKTTKNVILCVNSKELEQEYNGLNDNDYRFFTEIHNPLIYDYFLKYEKSNYKILSVSKYLPIFAMSYYNKELLYPSIFSIIKPNYRYLFDTKGNYTYPNSLKNLNKNVRNQTVNVEIKNPIFYEIEKFCIKKNINLIIYQSPIFNTKINILNLQSRHNFINHSDMNIEEYYYDNIHVNSKGRKYCSEKFCKIAKFK